MSLRGSLDALGDAMAASGPALDPDMLSTLTIEGLARLLAAAANADPGVRAMVLDALREAALQKQDMPASMGAADGFMVGAAPAMLDVFERCRRFAAVNAPVLITGESGTGKELAARAIHERSSRAAGPFVAINCAALPPSLVNAELFGHEKGAFTGATERRLGHIEAAHGGTLFLDEIGDLPIEVQGHLLRFLQDGLVTRLGGRKAAAVDARIISATHVPLQDAMRARRFREDLYYRLAVLTLDMPPLRTRGADIELLATVFLDRIATEFRKSRMTFAPDALAAIHAHAWPGNVRELIAVLRRAVVMSNGPMLRAADLALDPPACATPRGMASPVSTATERERLLEALEDSGQSVAGAARRLGVSRVTLYRMLARNGLQPRR